MLFVRTDPRAHKLLLFLIYTHINTHTHTHTHITHTSHTHLSLTHTGEIILCSNEGVLEVYDMRANTKVNTAIYQLFDHLSRERTAYCFWCVCVSLSLSLSVCVCVCVCVCVSMCESVCV